MDKRMNDEWEIIVAIPTDPGIEIVIGKRDTDFLPWVVWYCYDGNQYRVGEYLQTYEQAVKELAMRIVPTAEAHRMGEMQNFMEQCDEVIPYISDDDGFQNTKALYKNNYEFRRMVAEAYGGYWYRYLDDNTSDAKFDCVLDALIEAYREWKIKEE